jgi:hypothetical protein
VASLSSVPTLREERGARDGSTPPAALTSNGETRIATIKWNVRDVPGVADTSTSPPDNQPDGRDTRSRAL